jgi:hypothetical protein
LPGAVPEHASGLATAPRFSQHLYDQFLISQIPILFFPQGYRFHTGGSQLSTIMRNTTNLCYSRAGVLSGVTNSDTAVGLFTAFLITHAVLVSITYQLVKKHGGFAPGSFFQPQKKESEAASLLPVAQSQPPPSSPIDEPPPPYEPPSDSSSSSFMSPAERSEDEMQSEVAGGPPAGSKNALSPLRRRVTLFAVGSVIFGLSIAALVFEAFSIQYIKYCTTDCRSAGAGRDCSATGLWCLYSLSAIAELISLPHWVILLRDLFGARASRRWPIHVDLGLAFLMVSPFIPFILTWGIFQGLYLVWKGVPEPEEPTERVASDGLGNYTRVPDDAVEAAEETAAEASGSGSISESGSLGVSKE